MCGGTWPTWPSAATAGVLHTFSENDFAYYRDTMAEIVAISHDEGLFVRGEPVGARPHVRR